MSRSKFAILAAAFLVALLASVYFMAGRAASFNATSERKLWVFKPVNLREFRLAGRDVTLTDAKTAEGEESLVVKFGDRELVLTPFLTPGDANLPGLVRHTDWMKVLRFAEFGQRSAAEFQEHLDQGNDRLAIVVRRPLTGPDPRTGDVWQRDWTFDLHELLPDGSIRTEGLRFPKTRGDKTPKPNELKPGTWQMEAALHLMPKTPPDSLAIGRPTAAFRGDAMRSLGWTLPVSAISAPGLVVCIVLAAAPRRQAKPAS